MLKTCSEIWEEALDELGLSSREGVTPITRIDKNAVITVNHVYRDLYYKIHTDGFIPLKNIDDEVELPENLMYNSIHYGVAARIALDMGDGNMQGYFGNLYNQSLSQLNTVSQIIDVLPSVGGD